MKCINVQKLFTVMLLKPVVTSLLPFLSVFYLSGQGSSLQVYPRLGIGVGFFHPADVNDFIQNDLASIGYVNEFGTEDLFAYYDFQGALTFRFRHVDLSGDLGYAVAPKWVIITNGENHTYVFRRFSPGISCNFYVPTGKGRHSFFAGAGAMASFMKFRDYTATAPGLKFQAGMSLMFGKFNLQPHLAFVYCKKSAENQEIGVTPDFILNYSGVQFGVLLSAHPPVVRN